MTLLVTVTSVGVEESFLFFGEIFSKERFSTEPSPEKKIRGDVCRVTKLIFSGLSPSLNSVYVVPTDVV